jgi:biofilm protein TabA
MRLMIFDEINHIDRYYHLGRPLKDSADFLRSAQFSFQPQHTIEIGREGMIALLQEYSPTRKEDRTIESHHRFIDIQYMVEGTEYLGYANKDTLQSAGYDEEHDTEKLTGSLTFLPFREGFFAVLFPEDAHMPGVKASGSTKTVKKVVMKVPVQLWEK